MAAFSPFSPVDIRILPRDQGTAALESLLQGVDGVAVLASASMLQRLELGPFIERLLASHGGILIEKIPANPTVSDVCHTLRALDGRKVNTLVAIGGGSCIDLAKAVSALHDLLSGEELSEEAVLHAIQERAYTVPHSFIKSKLSAFKRSVISTNRLFSQRSIVFATPKLRRTSTCPPTIAVSTATLPSLLFLYVVKITSIFG